MRITNLSLTEIQPSPFSLVNSGADALAQAAKQGVTIDSLDIATEASNFLIWGHATKGSFGGSFSMRAKPELGTPDRIEHYEEEYGHQYTIVHPGSDNIWINVYDVKLDEELPWWVYLGVAVVCVLALPASPAILSIVIDFIESIRNDVVRQIDRNSDKQFGERVRRSTLPGTTEPFVNFAVSQLIVGNQGLQTRLFVTADYQFYSYWIEGKQELAAAAIPDTLPLRYSLNPYSRKSFKYHPNDPLIRISWQVRRQDTNAVIFAQDRWLKESGSQEITWDLREGDRRNCPKFTISCRVYRLLGTRIEEILNDTVTLKVIDRLDRTHPYVRWKHGVYIPQITTYSNGQRELTGYRQKDKKSSIHRTAIPGRCRFADRYTSKLKTPQDLETSLFPISAQQTPEYLDALPFPISDHLAHRTELCEYCFYGGPDKKKLLIPID